MTQLIDSIERGDLDRTRRMRRGYKPQLPDHVKAQLKAWEHPSLIRSIGWAVLYHLSIAAITGATLWAWLTDPYIGSAAYLLALILIARQQRGLELMVHDASHGAWHRDTRRAIDHPVNRISADLLVAIPSLSTVAAYWIGHRVHHGQYGSPLDPCRRRFAEMGLGHVDLSTSWAIAKAVLRWLPGYNLAYYKEIGSRSRMLLSAWAAWHITVYILPVALYAGLTTATLLWTLFWLVPMLVTLPVLRSIAEAEEHDYDLGETEFETTFTNDTLVHRLLVHPWNDAYHQVHHMYPLIPARLHHKVHKLLLENDETYRNSRFRTGILQS
jgi:fatty acid desaturase